MGDRGGRQPGGDRRALCIGHAVRDRGFVYMVLHPAVRNYPKLLPIGRHVILRSEATKNLQAAGKNRLNNAEILHSCLAQNDKIGVGGNLS